jgi:hypothetical protein
MSLLWRQSNPAEPFRFWVDSKKLVSLLTEHGIKIVEHIDANEMEKRYLTLFDGTLAEKSLEVYCFVHGTI